MSDIETRLVRTNGGFGVHKRECPYVKRGMPWIWAEGLTGVEIINATAGFGYTFCSRCDPLEGLPGDDH